MRVGPWYQGVCAEREVMLSPLRADNGMAVMLSNPSGSAAVLNAASVSANT